MNSSSKKPIIPRGIPQLFAQRAGHKPQTKPMVAQPKMAVSQSPRQPVAPPVYKPQPTLKIAQPKIATASAQTHAPMQSVRKPIAPPVYRPQATRVAVQAKFAAPTQIKKQSTTAPPVRRAQTIPKVLQTKKAISQPGAKIHPPVPRIVRPSNTVQRQYARGTYVEVTQGGRSWYGVITGPRHYATNTYRVRVGGTDEQVEVPAADIGLHPTISGMPRAAELAASRMARVAAYEERRDGDSVTTAGGTWTAVEYWSRAEMARRDPSGRIIRDPTARGLHIKLQFTPNHTVDATKIVLVQTVMAMRDYAPYFLDPSVEARAAHHFSIDQSGESRSPEYAANPAQSGGGFGSAPVQAGAGEHGHRYQCSPGRWCVKPAWIQDDPHLTAVGEFAQHRFETAAIAASGNDAGRYYGSVAWGYAWTRGGIVKLVPLDVVTAGYGASDQFRDSAIKWNSTPVGYAAAVQIPLPR